MEKQQRKQSFLNWEACTIYFLWSRPLLETLIFIALKWTNHGVTDSEMSLMAEEEWNRTHHLSLSPLEDKKASGNRLQGPMTYRLSLKINRMTLDNSPDIKMSGVVWIYKPCKNSSQILLHKSAALVVHHRYIQIYMLIYGIFLEWYTRTC